VGEWKKYKASDFIDFNPRESIRKGTLAKKVAMDKLQPFTRNIPGFEIEAFNGGSKFRNGDTIMARITPCLENGKTAKVSILGDGEIGFGSTEFIVLRAKPDVSDENFIYYLAQSPILRDKAIKSMVGSSGRQRVQQGVLNDTEFFVPPLEEQRRIGQILSALDDKIEENNKINHNLEQTARAVFEEYFDNVNTNAKLGEVVIAANTGGDAIRIAPIVDYNTGFRCIRVGDLTNNRDFKSWGFCKIKPTDFVKLQLKQGDVVVSRTASLGLNAFIYEDLQAVYNNGLIRLRPNTDKIYPLFLFLLLRQKAYFDFINRITGETSVRPNMKIEYLLSYPIIIPTLSEQEKLLEVLNPILQKSNRNIDETNNLAEIRNALLPRLMSGELSIDG
jgi:type I restriction enzyme S subunit